MAEFFAMGGYGGYVWSAFGFAALVLLGLLAQSWWAAHRREDELARLRDAVRSGRGAAGTRPSQPERPVAVPGAKTSEAGE